MKKLFIPPVLVFAGLIFIVLFYFIVPTFNLIAFPYNLAGLVIAFSGFVIMGKSWNLFNEYKTTLGFEKSAHFIREGIFLKTRNPMYIGMFLLLLGFGICVRNIFSIAVPFVFLFIIAVYFIPLEEKLMKKAFGEEYIDYMKKVKRWI